MQFIYSMPVLIRHLWQLKRAVFLHWCLICAVPFFKMFTQNAKLHLIFCLSLQSFQIYSQTQITFNSFNVLRRTGKGATVSVGLFSINQDVTVVLCSTLGAQVGSAYIRSCYVELKNYNIFFFKLPSISGQPMHLSCYHDPAHRHLCPANCYIQGTLTKRESSVQLTSSLKQPVS